MATQVITPPPQNGQTADDHRPVTELHVRVEVIQQMIGAEGGFVAHYYNDQGGNCTFGAGHLVHREACSPVEMQRRPTPAEMQQYLTQDLRVAENFVRFNVHRPLTQGQYDALVSLTFNAGLRGASPMFEEINRFGPENAE